MERKTKIFTGAASIALLLVFAGYYFSLFKGSASNVSTFTTLIIMLTTCTGILWMKQKTENKGLDVLLKINCVIFALWVITIVVQLFV